MENHAIETRYISCACNRVPQAADWGHNDLICYGACRAIALYQPRHPSCVVQTLVEHKDRVNSVQWIRQQHNGAEEEIVSSSTDKTAIVWKRKNKTKYEPKWILKGHSQAVTVAEGVYVPRSGGETKVQPRTLVATASADSTVKIWERKHNGDEFVCIQDLSFGTGFVMAASWIILPATCVPLLALAGDDQRVHLLVEENNKFVPAQTLMGHEDWIRGLDMTITDSGDILLASCSQDCFIRLWRISPRQQDQLIHTQSIGELSLQQDIKLKENTFTCTSQEKTLHYAVTLESVLSGHENWVYSVRWQPPIYKGDGHHQPLSLLSASIDKTMILWRPDPDTGVWVEDVRVGAVGGNILGFYGGLFSPCGQSIVAHGFQGAFHMWHKSEDSSSWQPGVTMGGHFESVQDIRWDPEGGDFLLSVSLDQTTRLHGYWLKEESNQSGWHEIARPQVHGYDMQCLSMINKYRLASGADEKVVRIFEAPRNFIENFGSISGGDVAKMLAERGDNSAPEGASVPALGLSNKAVFQGETQKLYEDTELQPQANQQYSEAYFAPLSLDAPPTEENLLQNTLWPEVQKLYGHGYEVFTVASHPKGTFLASACKAAKAEHACILLWDTTTWRQACKLESHSLTVTQLAFSHSGAFLLSVSRDRTWSLFKHNPGTEGPAYSRVAFTDKKTSIHTRIIWACSWSHDDQYFITVSRDKKAIIWHLTEGATGAGDNLGGYRACSMPLDLPDSVTAVDFAPVKLPDSRYLLAFGLENGTILLFKWTDVLPQTKDSWTKWAELDQMSAHHLTVKRLQFRPVPGLVENQGQRSEVTWLQLASCGADHAVKIHNVNVGDL